MMVRLFPMASENDERKRTVGPELRWENMSRQMMSVSLEYDADQEARFLELDLTGKPFQANR